MMDLNDILRQAGLSHITFEDPLSSQSNTKLIRIGDNKFAAGLVDVNGLKVPVTYDKKYGWNIAGISDLDGTNKGRPNGLSGIGSANTYLDNLKRQLDSVLDNKTMSNSSAATISSDAFKQQGGLDNLTQHMHKSSTAYLWNWHLRKTQQGLNNNKPVKPYSHQTYQRFYSTHRKAINTGTNSNSVWQSLEDTWSAAADDILRSDIDKEAALYARNISGKKPGTPEYEDIKSEFKAILSQDREQGRTYADTRQYDNYYSATSDEQRTLMDELSNTQKGAKEAYLNSRNARFLSRKSMGVAVAQAAAERDKDMGLNIHRYSSRQGYTSTRAQASKASSGALIKDILAKSAPVPFNGSALNIMAQNMGVITREERIAMAKAGNGAFSRIVTHGGGILGSYVALTSDNPGTEYLSNIIGLTSMQLGWQQGKSLGSLLYRKDNWKGTLARVTAGGLLGATKGLTAYGLIQSLADLQSNESHIISVARNLSKKEVMGSTYESDMALTLRQRGLQKMASSALNNRGQLLGNEAQTLRGQGYFR